MRSKIGIVDDPRGLRHRAEEAAHDRGVVEVAEDGELRVRIVAVAVPDRSRASARGAADRRRRSSCSRCVEVAALLVAVLEPELARHEIAEVLGGQIADSASSRVRKVGIDDREVVVGIEEGDEELILDHVDRDLAAAHRAADEGHDEVLRVVEQVLVAARARESGRRRRTGSTPRRRRSSGSASAASRASRKSAVQPLHLRVARADRRCASCARSPRRSAAGGTRTRSTPGAS